MAKSIMHNNHYLFIDGKNVWFYILYPFLFLLSLAYAGCVRIMRAIYLAGIVRSYRPRCVVVSVGNITVGGTGKTPTTEWLVRYLTGQRKKVGIIIRGYKRPKAYVGSNQLTDYFSYGDEAAMLKGNFPGIPVLVGGDKVKSARQLEAQNYEAAILDDGFQHWRLHRDLDIVTIDSSFSLEGQHILPLGRLREPLDGLRRADVFVITKVDLHPDRYKLLRQQLLALNPRAVVVGAAYQPVSLIHCMRRETIAVGKRPLENTPACAVAGIVQPDYFLKILGDCGIKVNRAFLYPDHHEYQKKDIARIKQYAVSQGIATLITTQKDAARMEHTLDELRPLTLYSIKIELNLIDNAQALSHKIDALFSSSQQ